MIDDPRYGSKDKSGVERVLVCSGHVYYDMLSSPLYEKAEKPAIVRVDAFSGRLRPCSSTKRTTGPRGAC